MLSPFTGGSFFVFQAICFDKTKKLSYYNNVKKYIITGDLKKL